jgi:hypothetical protein
MTILKYSDFVVLKCFQNLFDEFVKNNVFLCGIKKTAQKSPQRACRKPRWDLDYKLRADRISYATFFPHLEQKAAPGLISALHSGQVFFSGLSDVPQR